MRIDHCKYVIAVAENCNIRQAAESLYITQQGLSQAIRTIERELNVKLFTRTVNSLYPTAEGIVAIEQLKKIVGEYDRLQESLKALEDGKDKTDHPIELFVTPNVSYSMLQKIIAVFFKKEGHPLLKITEALPMEIVDELEHNEKAFAMMTIPQFLYESSAAVRDQKVKMEILVKAPLLGYVGQSSRLSELPRITSEHLRNTSLAIYPSEINMVQHLLEDETAQPNILINSSNIELYRSIVSKMDAIGFTTMPFERNTRAQPLTLIPLEKRVDIFWGCMHNAHKELSFWERELMVIMSSLIGKSNLSGEKSAEGVAE